MTAPVRSDPKAIEPELVEVELGARSYDIVIGRGMKRRPPRSANRRSNPRRLRN
jgi:hypothetical protein